MNAAMTAGSGLKWVVLAVVLLPVVYLLLALGHRALPLPAEQRDALALMTQPTPPVKGRDAAEVVWLWTHQVPKAERARVLKELLDYYTRHDGEDGTESRDDNPLSAFPEYPPTPGDGEGVCATDKLEECLDYVRANLQDVSATQALHRESIAAGMEVSDYDGLRYGITPSVSSPVPHLGDHRRLVITRFAFRFIQGETLPAVGELCRDLGGWRRLGADNDQLLAAIVGAAFVRQDLELLSHMLAELPAGFELPPACQSALAPVSDAELDLCPAMRGEFRGARTIWASADRDTGAQDDSLLRSTVDKRRYEGHVALGMSPLCRAESLALARQDRSRTSLEDPEAGRCSALEGSMDGYGCMLLDIAEPGRLVKYADRRTDQAAALGLMRSILWLRRQEGGQAAWPRLLAARPASLGVLREAQIAKDGRSLSIALLDHNKSKRLALAIGPAAAPGP